MSTIESGHFTKAPYTCSGLTELAPGLAAASRETRGKPRTPESFPLAQGMLFPADLRRSGLPELAPGLAAAGWKRGASPAQALCTLRPPSMSQENSA
jgi:hypothetical protein